VGQVSRVPDWPGWRGPNRDGHVPWLPEKLPTELKFLWQKKLSNQGLGGIAATDKFVVVVDRDLADATDIFHCFAADTGDEVWTVRQIAPGRLDYGNSPRATPLVWENLVFLYGAFGHFHCVELATGKTVWQSDLRAQFGASGKLVWGMACSPLVVDGKLILSPGGKEASLVAVEPRTGKVIWKSPGNPAAFASLVVGTFGGQRQLVGYDNVSLGGWDIATGKRLWTLVPEIPKDFNVPTPIVWGDKLVVATENNGTRIYDFAEGGKIKPQPLAEHFDLAPDTHTPVVAGDRLFGVWSQLYCLSLERGLKPIWTAQDEAFFDYATILATDERLLITSQAGELLLIDAKADEFKVLSRLKLFEGENGVYSHPALVGDKLYVRSSSEVVCLPLK
jgi:outer membrane protein assembly factor BamB